MTMIMWEDDMTNELVTVDSPYAIMPVLDIQAAAQRRQAVIDYTAGMMKKGTDYGVIPGTGTKPTLLKPGAEKLASLFGLSPDLDPIDTDMDWTGDRHGGEPFFYIQYRCTLKRGDLVVGQGVGSCNSWEKKYRYRNVYPNKATEEEKANGRLETRGGRNGEYKVYVVKNPDPADVVNTIDKMAQKRALVAAVLIAVNASELFTQDIEDYSDIIEGDWQPAPQPKAQPAQPARQAPVQPQPTAQAQAQPAQAPATNGKTLYGNGVVVRPEKMADYNAYCQAHDGAIPAAPKHLDNWLASLTDDHAQPAPVTEAHDQPLFNDDPDAVQAALDTAMGEID